MDMSKNATKEQIDRAHEWTVEHYSDAGHEEYENRFAAALADILAIDAAADTVDALVA
jgi:hypothetical protein